MTFTLNPRQIATTIDTVPRRLNIWHGSVSSGKTIGSLFAWLLFIEEAPPGNLLMVGKTERTLRDNVLNLLPELLGGAGYSLKAGAGEATILGRKVMLRGANDIRAEEKIRGLSIVGAYADEITLYPESFFTMLLSRLRLPGARLFGTTNPDTPRHWLRRGYLQRDDELDIAAHHFTLADNPALDPAYVAAIKAEYTGLWYRRFILGEWVAAEGSVYDMLTDGVHIVDEFPALTGPSDVGADYGTSNPTVFLRGTITEDNRLLIHDEYRHVTGGGQPQHTDAQHSAAFVKWAEETAERRGLPVARPRRTHVDPSAASFRLQLRRDGVGGVTEANNDVLAGIRDVASLLAAGRLIIHGPSCQALINEMYGYVWDERAQQAGEDKPLKQDDHGPDALRYLVRGMRRYWRPWLAYAPND